MLRNLAFALLLTALLSGLATAATMTVSLTAPASDPDINTGGTFTLTVHLVCGGGSGNCNGAVVYPQYCASSGCSNFTDMPTSGTGLTSNVASISNGNMARGSTSDQSFTVTGNNNGSYVVRGRVDWSGANYTTGSQAVTVKSPAALSATITASPASVNDSATITVTMTVNNTGTRPAVNVTPSSLTVNVINGTANATLLTGPSPSIANITGGSSQNFTWVYNASGGASGGNINFSGTASGKDNKTGSTVTSSSATSNAVAVAGKPTTSATLTAPASDPDLNTGQAFTLSVQVSCSSGACANVVVYPRYCTGSLSCTPGTDITTATTDLTSNVNSVSLGTVNSGSPQTANFTITGNTAGNYTVGGRYTSTPNNGNASGTQGVSAKSPASISATITASPASVNDTDTITVVMNVSNSGTRPAVNVTPSSLTVNVVSGTASASLLTGPTPSTINVTGNGWAAFNWTYNASSGASGGNISFKGNASGKDNKTGSTVSAANATSNSVNVQKKSTNLSIWDESDANRTYANMTKYTCDAVAFYANYTKATDNSSLSNATCQISIYNGTNWTAWANMTWTSSISLFKYNYTAGFPENGTFAWNVTCNQTGVDDASANDTVLITPRTANISVWDDTDTVAKYINETFSFYSNYTSANGTTIDGNGTCQVSFNVSGSWTAWANMTYQNASAPYIYSRNFTANGTFNWNATCSKACYPQKNATSTFVISVPTAGAAVTAGKASYAGCASVYCRVRLFDSSDFPITAAFDLKIIDSANATRLNSAGLSPNNGTGTYTGAYSINSSGPSGGWYIKALSGSAVGTTTFTVPS